MGYYNPPQEVEIVGRRLEGKTYEELIAQLQPGELLFGLYQKPLFKLAPHIYSQTEFEKLKNQVYDRVVKRIGFYAVNEAKTEGHME